MKNDTKCWFWLVLGLWILPHVDSRAVVAGPGFEVDARILNASAALGNQRLPAMARGSNFALVVWEEWRNEESTFVDIYGVRVDTNGLPLDATNIVICAASGDQLHPAVAAIGDTFLVVWEDYRNATGFPNFSTDIYGARIGSDGTVIDPAGIPICTFTNAQKNEPTVAASGTNWFVVWSDFRNGSNPNPFSNVYGTMVRPNGTVVSPAG